MSLCSLSDLARTLSGAGPERVGLRLRPWTRRPAARRACGLRSRRRTTGFELTSCFSSRSQWSLEKVRRASRRAGRGVADPQAPLADPVPPHAVANFAAYTFAPPALVTPLGALSVLVGAILAAIFLGERLGKIGVVGCSLCLVGSLVIVLHAPEDKEINTVDEILEYALQPGASRSLCSRARQQEGDELTAFRPQASCSTASASSSSPST